MPLTTRSEWELAIIRCAERWPDRVGLKFELRDGPCGTKTCIVGQCYIDAGVGVRPNVTCALWMVTEESAKKLVRDTTDLNDQGVPWGQIPRLLGLVPGESPAESESEAAAAGCARSVEGAALVPASES